MSGRGRNLTRPPHRSCVTAANSRSVWYAPPTGWVTVLAGLLARGSLPVRPAFPVSQWLTRTTGSPLTVAGAATASVCTQRTGPCSLLPPRREPGNQHMLSIPGWRGQVKIMSRNESGRGRKSARCCIAATEYRARPWHSRPACGLWGRRTPAAVTQAGYAYCQLRNTRLSVQNRHGHAPRGNGARTMRAPLSRPASLSRPGPLRLVLFPASRADRSLSK